MSSIYVQLMLLNRSIGEMHSQASAQGCRRATNVISSSKHTGFVRSGEFVNDVANFTFPNVKNEKFLNVKVS